MCVENMDHPLNFRLFAFLKMSATHCALVIIVMEPINVISNKKKKIKVIKFLRANKADFGI